MTGAELEALAHQLHQLHDIAWQYGAALARGKPTAEHVLEVRAFATTARRARIRCRRGAVKAREAGEFALAKLHWRVEAHARRVEKEAAEVVAKVERRHALMNGGRLP